MHYSSGFERERKRFPSPHNRFPIVAEAGRPFAALASAPLNLRRGNCIDGDLTRR